MTPETTYQDRLHKIKSQQKKRLTKKSLFAWLRLVNVAAIAATFTWLGPIHLLLAVCTAIVLLAIFIRLIYRDLSNRSAIKQLGILYSINEEELLALKGHYFQFGDGMTHMIKDHPYAADIDILGHASLFQLVNRTTSAPGEAQLAQWLLHPAPSDEILRRQEAVKELSGKTEWQQALRAYGKRSSIQEQTVRRLQQWIAEPVAYFQQPYWKWLRIVLPVIILAVCTSAIAGWIPDSIMYASLLLYAALAYQVNKVVAPLHERLSHMVGELETLSDSIALIEKEPFHAGLLLQVQTAFTGNGLAASGKIRQLKKLLDRLDLRYNIVVAVPLNILLLWNLQQVLGLEKWKKAQVTAVESWFHHLGIAEALSSFATIHFNNPGWVFPVFKQDHFYIKANSLGHPLIPGMKRVNNDIDIEHRGELMLVTGSNMAGKSTYLRSVGVNVVLAMAGAPVCARLFALSPVQLVSSMRIADNLEESTSTFYAELKKLKTVIDKVNAGEKVFILLDEILRGTNSLDRHKGSVALIRQLIRQKAAAIIATHDLALAEIKNEFPSNILNFHFDAQVNGEELYFDYLLKPGICQSLNASILMKKIGIDM